MVAVAHDLIRLTHVHATTLSFLEEDLTVFFAFFFLIVALRVNDRQSFDVDIIFFSDHADLFLLTQEDRIGDAFGIFMLSASANTRRLGSRRVLLPNTRMI